MKIWVDADACPKVIKDILCRAADRVEVSVVFVANQRFRVPESSYISLIQVGQGPDVADDEIVDQCEAGDLIITADIPLAARIVEKGALALDPRGKIYDKNNIGQILDMRNFMDTLRGSGVETGGPNSFGQKERYKFANELDKFLASAKRRAN
ncbi:MAG: YaiI/YqxD family protein [Nitrospinaceae bacterium]